MGKLIAQLFKFSFFLLFGCGTNFVLDSYQTSEKTHQLIENKYFLTEKEYLYRAKIDVYGNHLSGLLVLKKTDEKEYRIVLTTDFGNTLFSFLYIDNQLKVNYIQEDLNKKIIINTLSNSFSKLLKNDFLIEKKYISPNQTILEINDGKDKIYLYENNEKQIVKQINTKRNKKYTTFTFENKNDILQKIQIQYHTLKININLNIL